MGGGGWDPLLFAGSAGYYEEGRVPYSPLLAATMARSLALDGRGRLLDIGCGPGTVMLRVAHLFDEVVGLDPDEPMLREGRRLAARRGVANARWVAAPAEHLPLDLGLFRVVVFAQSIHWLDRFRVAGAVHAMLDDGGVIIHLDRTGPDFADDADLIEAELPYPTRPTASIEALVRRYLGEARRDGRRVIGATQSGEDAVLRAAGFIGPEVVRVPFDGLMERTSDQLVAETFSLSSSAPHLFGSRKDDFERDLRRLLREVSPIGRFSIRTHDNLLKIWRPVGRAWSNG